MPKDVRLTRTFAPPTVTAPYPRHALLKFGAWRLNILWSLVVGAWCFSPLAAFSQAQYIETIPHHGSFPLAQENSTAAIIVDTNDWPGVVRAAHDLQADINRVTSHTPEIFSTPNLKTKTLIIIGTIGKSEMIDRLIRTKKIDVSEISNQWESFFLQVVPKPMPGVASALVICGSDKRGTIYGIYDLSEQIGVSPWYFCADVPVPHRDSLFVKAGKFVQGPPAVKYRGIFLNDEAPSLAGWAKAKYGGFNHQFYTNVFELLLRLKANYLWPAMWDNCFNEDDPLNPQLADEYGIVMGTSHVEPMMRADKEWNRAGHDARDWNFQTHSNALEKFWRAGLERNKNYESIITMAMRGKIDTPMSPTANIALLENIVAAQRKIVADVYQTNVKSVPQLWALYKEVQEYYEKGMRVPDDVTLLWCDDNWGNLRRLPTPDERQRRGGAGVYYHFDYVGDPRNYKWVNTVPLTKIWEQMNLAYNYGADRIWIVNVGSLKLKELPISFFLKLAWNPSAWPSEKIPEFTRLWAEQQFGSADAPQIADLLAKYTKYNGRRKPELLSPETFSLVDYQEADRVLADWKTLVAEAEVIYQKLPTNERDAFFELVLYPVKASAQVNELYIAAAKNHWFACQSRASANDFADTVKNLFQADADLSAYYNHAVADGKWPHIMDQTHIGYTGWQQPETNIMPQVSEIELPVLAKMGVAIEGSTNVWPDSVEEAILPAFDKFNQPTRYLDVFNQGKTPFAFSATTSTPWISLSLTHGLIEKEQRILVTVDWKNAPAGSANGFVKISDGTRSALVNVEVFNPANPSRDPVKGFVEADGYIAIEAEHFTRKVNTDSAHWAKLDDAGRTLSAMTIFPVTADSVTPTQHSPRLEYQMYLFHAGRIEVETILSPSLNFVPKRGLRFALSFDDQPPQIITAVPENYTAGGGNKDWEQTVSDGVRKIKSSFTVEKTGEHTLKFWMVDPGVVLQKLVVNLGGVKPSYLGPPESFHN